MGFNCGPSVLSFNYSPISALVHEPAVLIEGVLFRARYLGSTQMVAESCGSKAARMSQAQEAVARVKVGDMFWNLRESYRSPILEK